MKEIQQIEIPTYSYLAYLELGILELLPVPMKEDATLSKRPKNINGRGKIASPPENVRKNPP